MPSQENGRLSFIQKFSYSVGHVLNDLTASMWFTYMIIYFHQVKNFDNDLAGYLVLLGQISDGLFTPFIGYESDRVKGCGTLGKRKSWYVIGTICVIISFPFLFVGCISCDNSSDLLQTIYYAPFVVIFQFGWAATQISHLSLLPELTEDSNERVGLNGSRYAFTVLSNLVVYGIAWAIFDVNNTDKSHMLSSTDANKFRLLVFIITGIGICFSIIFHLGVKEKCKLQNDNSYLSSNGESSSSLLTANIERSMVQKLEMSWKCWLKEHQFYQITVLYMVTRLIVNISQVYLPMYLTESIKLDKLTYFVGIIFTIGASVGFYFLPKGSKFVYGAAILSGIGGSTILITALAMTADLIHDNTESGAFVYGAMSFTDKITNGVAIALIQHFHPCSQGSCEACIGYYRQIMSFLPGGMCILAVVALATLIPQTLGVRRKKAKLQEPVINKHTMDNGSVEEMYKSWDETEPLLSGKKPNVSIQ